MSSPFDVIIMPTFPPGSIAFPQGTAGSPVGGLVFTDHSGTVVGSDPLSGFDTRFIPTVLDSGTFIASENVAAGSGDNVLRIFDASLALVVDISALGPYGARCARTPSGT